MSAKKKPVQPVLAATADEVVEEDPSDETGSADEAESKIITEEIWHEGLQIIKSMYQGRAATLIAGFAEVVGKRSLTIEATVLNPIYKELKFFPTLSEIFTDINTAWRSRNRHMRFERTRAPTRAPTTHTLVYKVIPPSRTKAGKAKVNSDYDKTRTVKRVW